MARGEHVFVMSSFCGIPFQHHGIDIGDGTVVHLAPDGPRRLTLRSQSSQFLVRQVSMNEFCQGRPLQIVQHKQPRSAELVVASALGCLGQCDYHWLDNNCEHFAYWCVHGKTYSRQVEMGHLTAQSLTSMVAKGCLALGQRYAAKVAIRSAARLHPLSLVAEGVEIATIAGACAAGLDAARTRSIARFSGEVTAAAVGCLLAGPVGGAANLAIHRGSQRLAAQLCDRTRQQLSPSNITQPTQTR